MDSVTHEQAELDDGAPLLLVVIAGELILVGDPRIIPEGRLAAAADQIRQWMRESALTVHQAVELLIPHLDQIIKGGAAAPPAPGRAAA